MPHCFHLAQVRADISNPLDETAKPTDQISTALSKNALPPPLFTISDIINAFTSYAIQRAGLIANPAVTKQSVEEFDDKFAKSPLVQYVAELKDPKLIERLHRLVIKTQNRACQQEFLKRTYQQGLEIATAIATIDEEKERKSAVKKLLKKWRDYSKGNCVLSFNPKLLRKAATLRRKAELLGIAMALKAHESSAEFYKETSRRLPFHRPRIEKLFTFLVDKTPSELKLFETIFKKRYRRCPMQRLISATPKGFTKHQRAIRREKLSVVNALLEGNREKASAIMLFLRCLSAKTESAVVRTFQEFFEEFPFLNASAVIKEFKKRYKANSFKPHIRKLIPSWLASPSESLTQYFNAVENKNSVEANCWALKILSNNPSRKNSNALSRLIASRDIAELQNISKVYFEITGENVASLTDRIKCPYQRELLLSAFSGDKLLYTIARLHSGVYGIEGGALIEIFSKATLPQDINYEQYRDKILRAYQERYGKNLLDDLKKQLNHRQYSVISSVIDNGEISRAELLRICMEGIGTDEENIKKILDGLTKEEIEEVKKDFSRRYKYSPLIMAIANHSLLGPIARATPILKWWVPKNPKENGNSLVLEDELKWEMSGDAKFDVLMMLQGTPTNFKEWLEKIKAYHSYELSGFFMPYLNFFSRENGLMQQSVNETEKFYSAFAREGVCCYEERLRFEFLTRLCFINFRAFREYKEFLAEHTANVVGGFSAVGVATAAFEAGMSPLLAGAAAASASIASRWLLKWAIKGKGYTRGEESLKDLLLGVVDGATLRAGTVAKYFGEMLRGYAGKTVVKSLVKYSLRQAAESAEKLGKAKKLEEEKSLNELIKNGEETEELNLDPSHPPTNSVFVLDASREALFKKLKEAAI